MKSHEYSFLELVNINEIKKLMTSYYKLTRLSLALVDLDGNIMTYQDGGPVSVGWQDFCLNIGCENPNMLKNYIKTSVKLDKCSYESCYENGLSNMSVPIYIDDEYMASFFIGSFFLEEPDIEFLREEAHTHGFDEEEYLDTISKIPLFSADYIHKCLDFLSSVANVIGELGLEKKRLLKDRQLIKEREKTLQFQLNILKNVRHCIIVYDTYGKIIYWNDSAESIYGYSEEEMLGKNIKILYSDFDPEESVPMNIQSIMELGEYVGEWEGRRKDGSKVSVDLRETVFYGTKNEIIGIIGVSKDITQRKRAELKIKESLEEKEVLLQEIHHRVKNNLQIISSLLNLQTYYVEGEESINVLKDSQNRVKTMAIVHEKLYQSPNLKDINFKEYIEDLISGLFYSYGIESKNIKTEINLEDLKIDIDTAIPCGLIINELVTNCLKYAFPDKKGILKVELTPKSDYINLIVADNGVGLPPHINIENTNTLGLKMVNSLVHQLEGTLKLNRTSGTEFIIKFKELKYKYKNRI
jgi:PAS domain S-box-containing protein